jgi:transcriptional regulator with XRE-family HTH domain
MAGNADIHQLRTTVSTAARAARLRAGLSQADVAAGIGIVTEVYGRLERSHLLPSVPTLRRLCLTLRVSADEFLGLDPSKTPDWPNEPPPQDPPPLRRLLRTLRALSPEHVKLIGGLAQALKRGPPPKRTKGR